VLIVSHDRDFLDRTVTVTLGLDGSGTVDVVAGGYADWEAKRKNTGGAAEKKVAKAPQAPPPPPAPKSVKLSYKDQRDYDLLPARIEELEAEIARGEKVLADPDLYTRDPARFASVNAAIEKARDEKDAAELRWLELAEQVEG
jgi:ATP-binding cassette subfamily F protein uup